MAVDLHQQCNQAAQVLVLVQSGKAVQRMFASAALGVLPIGQSQLVPQDTQDM
ncbi:hypothetical protein D3C85_1916320 [compost metagenome]